MPPSACRNLPILSCVAPVNAPRRGRTLAFEQRVGQGAAAHLDERRLAAVAVLVDGAGRHRLAGDALAEDQTVVRVSATLSIRSNIFCIL